MFNQRLLSLLMCAGIASVVGSPLSTYYPSAYGVQKSAVGLGGAFGEAINNAISSVTSGLHLAVVSDDNRGSVSYDQTPMNPYAGDKPIIVVLPGLEGLSDTPTSMKGTVGSKGEFGWNGTFYERGVPYKITGTYSRDRVPEWSTEIDGATLYYYDKEQLKGTWTFRGVIGPNEVFFTLEGHGCRVDVSAETTPSFKPCPTIRGALKTPLSQGYPVDGSALWSSPLSPHY